MVQQTSKPGQRTLGAEVGTHGDHQIFQGGSAGKLIVDDAWVTTGDCLDHGADSRAVERRHDDAVFGQTDEVARQQAVRVGGDADNGTAQLDGGGETPVVGGWFLSLALIHPPEDHHRAGVAEAVVLRQ